MSGSREMDDWAESADLTPDTVELLRKEGFSSLRLLRHLTPDLLSTNFQKRLPLGQHLALTAALEDLRRQESSTVRQSERRQIATSHEEQEGGHETLLQELGMIADEIRGQRAQASPTSVEQPPTREAGQVDLSHVNYDDEDVRGATSTLPLPSLSVEDTEAWQRSYYFDRSSSQTMRFFLMGKTGGGKSATGNTILEEPLFDADIRFSSVTSSCSFHAKKRHGITIEITDSPGLCDTMTPEEDIAGKVVQAVACMNPGPTAFLYVISITRYTEEDEGVYQRIKSLFDDRVTRYTIIIFTRGDQLKKQKKTIEDILSTAPDSLRKALRECNNRYVVFDNMADDKQPQVKSLLQLVRKMSEENGWIPYTCHKYKKVGEQMNKEVARRLRKVQEKELKRKKYVQELEKKTKLAEEKAKQERIAFERKEAEREERMKKAEEEREEKMEALQKMINEQKLSTEKQKEEERKLQEEREEMMKKLEKERADELQRIKKQMEEANQLLKDRAAALEAEREAHRELMEERETVEQNLKTEIAEKSESSCIIL